MQNLFLIIFLIEQYRMSVIDAGVPEVASVSETFVHEDLNWRPRVETVVENEPVYVTVHLHTRNEDICFHTLKEALLEHSEFFDSLCRRFSREVHSPSVRMKKTKYRHKKKKE